MGEKRKRSEEASEVSHSLGFSPAVEWWEDGWRMHHVG